MTLLTYSHYLGFLNCKLKNKVFWMIGSRVKVLVETGFSKNKTCLSG
jgi:hypothetical protein